MKYFSQHLFAFVVVVTLCALLAPFGSVFGEDAALAQWPMYGCDAQHMNRSPASINQNGSGIKWETGAPLMVATNSMVIGPDGTIYVSGRGSNLYAVSSDGKVKWTYPIGEFSDYSPAIAPDGTIYVTSWGTTSVVNDHKAGLDAINPNGTLKWRYGLTGNVADGCAPLVTPNGTIVFCYKEYSIPTIVSNFCALDPNGSLIWKYSTDDFLASNPALGPDSTTYALLGGGKLLAINDNGKLQWDLNVSTSYLGASYLQPPTIGLDGTIYIGGVESGPKSNYLAINPNGTVKWSCDFEPEYPYDAIITGPSALSDNGTVFFCGGGGIGYTTLPDGNISETQIPSTVYAVDASGHLLWKRQIVRSYVASSLILDSSSDLIVCGGNSLYLFTTDGSLQSTYTSTGKTGLFSPVLGADGTLYFLKSYGQTTGIVASDGMPKETAMDWIYHNWVTLVVMTLVTIAVILVLRKIVRRHQGSK